MTSSMTIPKEEKYRSMELNETNLELYNALNSHVDIINDRRTRAYIQAQQQIHYEPSSTPFPPSPDYTHLDDCSLYHTKPCKNLKTSKREHGVSLLSISSPLQSYTSNKEQLRQHDRYHPNQHRHHSSNLYRNRKRQQKETQMKRNSRCMPGSHLLEKFTSPNIELSQITVRSKEARPRIGLFNKGKSSAKGSKHKIKNKAAMDMVFQEANFLRNDSTSCSPPLLTLDGNCSIHITSVGPPSAATYCQKVKSSESPSHEECQNYFNSIKEHHRPSSFPSNVTIKRQDDSCSLSCRQNISVIPPMQPVMAASNHSFLAENEHQQLQYAPSKSQPHAVSEMAMSQHPGESGNATSRQYPHYSRGVTPVGASQSKWLCSDSTKVPVDYTNDSRLDKTQIQPSSSSVGPWESASMVQRYQQAQEYPHSSREHVQALRECSQPMQGHIEQQNYRRRQTQCQGQQILPQYSPEFTVAANEEPYYYQPLYKSLHIPMLQAPVPFQPDRHSQQQDFSLRSPSPFELHLPRPRPSRPIFPTEITTNHDNDDIYSGQTTKTLDCAFEEMEFSTMNNLSTNSPLWKPVDDGRDSSLFDQRPVYGQLTKLVYNKPTDDSVSFPFTTYTEPHLFSCHDDIRSII